jgi:hypothetical protein
VEKLVILGVVQNAFKHMIAKFPLEAAPNKMSAGVPSSLTESRLTIGGYGTRQEHSYGDLTSSSNHRLNLSQESPAIGFKQH